MKKVLVNKNLSREEAYDIFANLSLLPLSEQITALTLFDTQEEITEGLLGALDYFSQYSLPITCAFDVVDIVGTGGDAIGTFNISTAASLVIASCDVYVAKHGGRSSTSQAGSMDTAEYLGLSSAKNSEEVLKSLEENHYAYLWAPLFNTEFKKFRELRKKINSPTVFNILGPLLNPLKPKRQIIGVYRKDLVNVVANILNIQGAAHALVVHAYDGLDEFSVSSPSYVTEIKNGIISEYVVHPQDLGIQLSRLPDIIGGTPRKNAQIIIDILSSEIQGPKLDILVLNSAAGLYVSGKVSNLKEGIDMAKQSISDGKTIALLDQLKRYNHA
jgi:anthranilate phosphoribosyltransferase